MADANAFDKKVIELNTDYHLQNKLVTYKNGLIWCKSSFRGVYKGFGLALSRSGLRATLYTAWIMTLIKAWLSLAEQYPLVF